MNHIVHCLILRTDHLSTILADGEIAPKDVTAADETLKKAYCTSAWILLYYVLPFLLSRELVVSALASSLTLTRAKGKRGESIGLR